MKEDKELSYDSLMKATESPIVVNSEASAVYERMGVDLEWISKALQPVIKKYFKRGEHYEITEGIADIWAWDRPMNDKLFGMISFIRTTEAAELIMSFPPERASKLAEESGRFSVAFRHILSCLRDANEQ